MLRKLFRFFLLPLQATMICLLIATGGFLWRLHQGPINIDRLVPYIAQIAAFSDTETGLSVETAELRWGGLRHLIDFHVKGFKAFDDQNRLIASIPQLSFSFSLVALLQGTIAPRTLVIYRPYLNLTLNNTGEIQQNIQENDSTMALDALFQTLKREKHLVEFSLIKAKIKITDIPHNAVWNIPEADLAYSRRFRKNKLDGFIKLDLGDGRFQSLMLKGRWKRKNKKIPLTLQTENLNLPRLLSTEKYPFLKDITTPINLTVETLFDPIPLKSPSLAHLRKAVDRIDFTLTGGEGTIDLPDPVIARYDIKRFTINGSIRNFADGFNLSRIDLTMQNGATAQGNMTVSGIGAAIDSGEWRTIKADLTAKAQNVPMAMLASYWPASLGPDVHDWVKRNIRGGMIDSADFILRFKGLPDEKGIDIDTVDGTIDVTGTQVVYLDDMPSVNNVSGRIHLTHNDLIATIKQASCLDVTAQSGGTFSILGMTEPVTTAALNVNATGGIPDILEILDAPALRFMSEIGIDPRKTTGTGKGNLQLRFPLGDAFKSADQIEVKVDAEVHNADVDDIVLGLGLQDAILTVNMDGKALFLKGTALFYGATAKYSLNQSFDPADEIMTDIKLHVNLNDKARTALNYPFFTAPAISGVMPTDLSLILRRNHTGTLKIDSDLTEAGIDLREIGWEKRPKIAGKGVFVLNLVDGQPAVAPVVSLTDAAGSSVRADLLFANGELKTVSISDIKTPRTNATVTLDFSDDKEIAIIVNGTELDISGLLKKGTSLNVRASPSAEKKKDFYSVSLNASIDRMWLSEKGYAEHNTVVAYYSDGWENMRVNSFLGERKVPLRFSMMPTATSGLYKMTLSSDDAGYALKALDYISTVKGGKLEMNAIYTADVGSKGTLNISDFYLEDDQTLIRILQMTSFTGIIDTLRGNGLFFEKAEVPFTTDTDSATIDSALAFGSSLGITLNGKYYLETGYMNLYGSIIPFYSVNSFLGKIPLIGGLFAGEKGGGLIAPTYTIKGKMPSPDISVNGLSALAPGAIRSVFGKIARKEGDLSRESQQKQPVEQKETYKPIAPSAQTEIKDEEIHHTPKSERILEP